MNRFKPLTMASSRHRRARGATPVLLGAANSVTAYHIDLAGANATLTVTGTVTETGTAAPIKGVQIKVDGAAPLNAATSGGNKGKLVTGDDGTYTAIIPAKAIGELSHITVSKSGYVFTPASFPVPALAGTSATASFTGYTVATISGRVAAPGGGPMSGVMVKVHEGAVPDLTKAAVDSVTTTATGTFSLDVAWGTFTIRAEVADADSDDAEDESDRLRTFTWFGYPGAANGVVAVAPSQPGAFGQIQAKSVAPRVTAKRLKRTTTVAPAFSGDYTSEVELTWEYETDAAHVVAAAASATIQTKVGTGEWTPAATTGTVEDAEVKTGTTDTYEKKATISISNASLDGEFSVRVGHPATDDDGGAIEFGTDNPNPTSDAVEVAAVATQARGVAGKRVGAVVSATWSATGSARLVHRVVLQVAVSDSRSEWLVVPEFSSVAGIGADATRVATGADKGKWSWSFDLAAWLEASPTGQPFDLADGTGSITVTKAMLEEMLTVRVESQNATTRADADADEWEASTNTGSVTEKP